MSTRANRDKHDQGRYDLTIIRCVDKKTGVPIFGLEQNMTVARLEMSCGCARQVEELREMSCNMKVKYDGPESDSIAR